MLYPIFGMVALTFVVLFIGLGARISAVKSGKLQPDSFRLNPTNGVSEAIVKTTRHFANLFEMPILFYVACLLCLVMDLSSVALVTLAWGYVLARAIHAFVHITYNNVTHRLVVFAVSNLALLSIWGLIAASTV
jgi:hypothetical protein